MRRQRRQALPVPQAVVVVVAVAFEMQQAPTERGSTLETFVVHGVCKRWRIDEELDGHLGER